MEDLYGILEKLYIMVSSRIVAKMVMEQRLTLKMNKMNLFGKDNFKMVKKLVFSM